MKRIALTDGSGRWFDIDAAQCYVEDTRWDGHNHISRNTNSEWDHEDLYATSGGRWIKHTFSGYEGILDQWVEITDEYAARWLSINGHWEADPSIKSTVAALEIK